MEEETVSGEEERKGGSERMGWEGEREEEEEERMRGEAGS